MQPFGEMNLSVRPHAIASWMAKDMHLYELLRAMPSLLEQFEDDVMVEEKVEVKRKNLDEETRCCSGSF
jgi:hypothetical protein